MTPDVALVINLWETLMSPESWFKAKIKANQK